MLRATKVGTAATADLAVAQRRSAAHSRWLANHHDGASRATPLGDVESGIGATIGRKMGLARELSFAQCGNGRPAASTRIVTSQGRAPCNPSGSRRRTTESLFALLTRGAEMPPI